jgi:VIT1/CCC1 family predicted Fe2+/Mn2+ transporter
LQGDDIVKQQEAMIRRDLEPSAEISNIKTATQPPLTPLQREETLNEKKRVARLSRIRQFVFGSLDGLLVPLGVVSGVAGGTGNIKAVIVAGLAEAFAGAISMGAGEFLSGRAEAQLHQAEVRIELEKIYRSPAYELQELIVILERVRV